MHIPWHHPHESNVCRSPIAEGLAKKWLSERHGVRVIDLEQAGIKVQSRGKPAERRAPRESLGPAVCPPSLLQGVILVLLSSTAYPCIASNTKTQRCYTAYSSYPTPPPLLAKSPLRNLHRLRTNRLTGKRSWYQNYAG